MLKDEYTFRTELFSRDKDSNREEMNCFWLPVFTREAQEHIVKLERGWNRVRDTLEKFTVFAISDVFSEDDMVIPDGNIIFDSNGNYL